MYLFDFGDGDETLHVDIQGEITLTRLKHFLNVFTHLLMGFIDRGLEEIVTWVEVADDTQHRFAYFFGFEPTGEGKIVFMEDGREVPMHRLVFDINKVTG